MSSEVFPTNVRSIDVFITYRCGLRCSHCFVGENLNTNLDMDFALFEKLVRYAKTWKTHEFTFLGGEPTLYPGFIEAVLLVQRQGFRARIVTNGHRSYSTFIDRFSDHSLPFICFSIDGSKSQIHDSIRGNGSFRILMKNIERSKQLGYRVGGIVAISRRNAIDAPEILRLCDSLELESVNVHYVTNRGFAPSDHVLSIDEWENTYNSIRAIAGHLRTQVRIEKTFHDRVSFNLKCAVAEKSNLMFLPDGRVFMCMMFIDTPNSHSFTWTTEGLLVNRSLMSEGKIAKKRTDTGCPAMAYVNGSIVADARLHNAFIQCIYEKEQLGGDGGILKKADSSIPTINLNQISSSY